MIFYTPEYLLEHFMDPKYVRRGYGPEYAVLSTLGSSIDPKQGLEFGTETGISADIFTSSCPNLHLTTVDFNHCAEARADLSGRNITFIQSTTQDLKWDKPVDFLFIDANHTHEDVTRELLFAPLVQRLILAHDIISFPPVHQALIEFARKHIGSWAYTPYLRGNGMGLLWRL